MLFFKECVLFFVGLSLLFNPSLSQNVYTQTATGQTTTQPTSDCWMPQKSTMVYGTTLTTFKNIEFSFCCELCYKIKDCISSQWTYPTIYQQSTCTLYNNISSVVYYETNSITLFPSQDSPFLCKTQVNRIYYELAWVRISNVTTMDLCIETCTLTSNCNSWAFDSDSLECLTSQNFYIDTKWSVYSGITTGSCIIQVDKP